jgi:hypothetical protein
MQLACNAGAVNCDDVGNVVSIALPSSGLNGSITSQIALLSELTYLYFGYNSLFSSLPSEIGTLSKLTFLDSRGNALSGPLPSQLGKLTLLSKLTLDSNNFVGSIPSELGLLANTATLYLYHNMLVGNVPPLGPRLTDCFLMYASAPGNCLNASSPGCARCTCQPSGAVCISSTNPLTTSTLPATTVPATATLEVGTPPTGCMCQHDDQSVSCIGGVWDSGYAVITAVVPFALWRLGQNSSEVRDSSDSGFNGTFLGPVNNNDCDAYTTFNGASYIDFGTLNGFQFATRDFAVEATVRFSSLGTLTLVARRHDISTPYFSLAAYMGSISFEVGSSHSDFVNMNSNEQRFNDGVWHVARGERRSGLCYIYVDEVLRAPPKNCSYDLELNVGSLTISAEFYPNFGVPCCFFVGDMANATIYVDSLPDSLCFRNGSTLVAGSSLSAACVNVLGFCEVPRSTSSLSAASSTSATAPSTTSRTTATISLTSTSKQPVVDTSAALPRLSMPASPSFPVVGVAIGAAAALFVTIAVLVLICVKRRKLWQLSGTRCARLIFLTNVSSEL